VPAWNPEITEILGIFRRASNATLLAVTAAGEKVIYKPTAGQRPLWDFDPDTLAAREWLAYEVSQALGAGVVPETILGTGPMGPGSIQRYVEPDLEVDLVAMVNDADRRLWPIAVLDIVINNADRKLGHLLPDHGGVVWAIDHGLTFHSDEKLRTVLWVFSGRPLPDDVRVGLGALGAALTGQLGRTLRRELGGHEADAIGRRVRDLQDDPVHPPPPDDRPPLPWPLE
jgi:uncharacterized repeat protein (TIGR03843 family)